MDVLSDVLQLFMLISRDLRETSLGSGGFLLMGTPVTLGQWYWQEHGILCTVTAYSSKKRHRRTSHRSMPHEEKDKALPATKELAYF